jgi:hypothetical protein
MIIKKSYKKVHFLCFRVVEAHTLVEENRTNGKVVLLW